MLFRSTWVYVGPPLFTSVVTLYRASPDAEVIVVLHGLSGVNVRVVIWSEADIVECTDAQRP